MRRRGRRGRSFGLALRRRWMIVLWFVRHDLERRRDGHTKGAADADGR